jgi:hypothetical protein
MATRRWPQAQAEGMSTMAEPGRGRQPAVRGWLDGLGREESLTTQVGGEDERQEPEEAAVGASRRQQPREGRAKRLTTQVGGSAEFVSASALLITSQS